MVRLGTVWVSNAARRDVSESRGSTWRSTVHICRENTRPRARARARAHTHTHTHTHTQRGRERERERERARHTLSFTHTNTHTHTHTHTEKYACRGINPVILISRLISIK